MDWRDFEFHHANDLEQQIAFIAGYPRNIPSISIEEFVGVLYSATESAIASVDGGREVDFTIEKYQIGSAAEWTQTFAVIVNAFPAIVSQGADLITWALAMREAVVTIRGYLRERELASGRNPNVKTPEPVVNMPFVVGMCLSHFQETVGDLDRISMSRHLRTSKGYLSSAEHPAGYETYTIGIRKGTANYIFVVLSNGRCVEHFVIESSKIKLLSLPDWLREQPAINELIQDEFADIHGMT